MRLVRRSPPLPYLLRASTAPFAVILGDVGDGVDSFRTRILSKTVATIPIAPPRGPPNGYRQLGASHGRKGMRGATPAGDLRSGLRSTVMPPIMPKLAQARNQKQ